MSVFLGLDVGTSVTKAGLFDDAGRELGRATRPTGVTHPQPGWSEADPELVWSAVTDLCRDMSALAARLRCEIAGVGVAGAMVGAWVVDGAGQPLRPAILWDDTRTQALIDDAAIAQPGFMTRIFASSGSVMQQGCTLPLLRWLLDGEPDTMRSAAAVFGSKDFVRFRLTGTMATDGTEAAVAPGSAEARSRSAAMLSMFDLSDHSHLLPVVRPSASLAGTVTANAAAATGLAVGTPVAIGAGDVPANIIGGGELTPGARMTVLGTTCLNGVLCEAPSFEPRDLGLLFTIPGGLWLRTMVNVSGTTALDWCVAALCPDLAGEGVFDRLEKLATTVSPGSDGLTFLPYLSPAGIIAPQVEPAARGGFAGLTTDHGRAHLVRAVYEGVMFAVASCYDLMGNVRTPIRLLGGGSRSRFWCQMLADITQSPVLIPEGMEFGARGAALLAATATGRYGTINEAVAATPLPVRRHEPDPGRSAAYAAARTRYDRASRAHIEHIARRG